MREGSNFPVLGNLQILPKRLDETGKLLIRQKSEILAHM